MTMAFLPWPTSSCGVEENWISFVGFSRTQETGGWFLG